MFQRYANASYVDNNALGYGDYLSKKIAPVAGDREMEYDKSVIIDPITGLLVVDTAQENRYVKKTPTDLILETKDFVKRELGISSQIVRNNRILKGLANPGQYLLLKNGDIDRIGDDCAVEYKDVFTKFVNYGMSVEQAKQKALKAANFKKEFLMKEHEINFPSDLTNEVMNKLKRKNETGGF